MVLALFFVVFCWRLLVEELALKAALESELGGLLHGGIAVQFSP